MKREEIISILTKCPLRGRCSDGLYEHCIGCDERKARDIAIQSLVKYEKVKTQILDIMPNTKGESEIILKCAKIIEENFGE